MKVEQANVLITGSNRGLGRALVSAALAAGAAKVYAACRRSSGLFKDDPRIIEVDLDVTLSESIESIRARCADTDILINNAAFLANASAYRAAALDHAYLEMETNYWGVVRMSRAFAPLMVERTSGAIVNILSIGALTGIPFCSSYCASKSASWSFTQSLSLELADQSTEVLAVFPGPIATEMARPHELEGRWPAKSVARSVMDGIGAAESRIFPDPVSVSVAEAFSEAPWSLSSLFAGSTE